MQQGRRRSQRRRRQQQPLVSLLVGFFLICAYGIWGSAARICFGQVTMENLIGFCERFIEGMDSMFRFGIRMIIRRSVAPMPISELNENIPGQFDQRRVWLTSPHIVHKSLVHISYHVHVYKHTNKYGLRARARMHTNYTA